MSLQPEFQQAARTIDITPEQGVAMMFDAVNRDEAETIRALAAAGIPVDCRNECGDTPLILAASKDQRAAAEELLRLGADANFLNSEGFNTLWYAARYPKCNMSDLLLDHGAKPETIAPKHLTPMLVNAVVHANERIVGLLLSAGAVTDAQTGARLLQVAARDGQAGIVTMLITAGADVNATDNNQASVLRAALEGKDFDTIKTLLDAGADTQNRSRDDSTGRNTTDTSFAAAHGSFEIARLVGDAAKTFEMIESARTGKAVEVEKLLKEGAKPDAIDRFGMTALLYASMNNDAEVARMLLSNGASAHARGRQVDLPIVAAAWNKGAAVIPLLCEAGASVFDKDSSDITAADLLTMRGASGADEATCDVIAYYRAEEIGREAHTAAHNDVTVAPMRTLRFKTPAPV